MKVIRYKSADEKRLVNFQKEHSFSRSTHFTKLLPLREYGNYGGTTIYLESKGRIEGIATAVYNELHPHFRRIHFFPNLEKTVSILFSELKKMPEFSGHPFEISLAEGEKRVLAAFLEKHKFQQVVCCEIPEIDLDGSLESINQFSVSKDFYIKNYSELSEDQKQLLFKFRIEGYFKTHEWNPPVSLDSEVWNYMNVSKEEEQVSWSIFKNNRIILCSDTRLIGETAMLGWGWHCDQLEQHPLLNALWGSVLKRQLMWCTQNNRVLLGEFDSTDSCAQLKSSLLQRKSEDIKYIFQQTV